ncbi:MAG: hypothetical protein ACLVGL_07415 [Waltera sp.]
MSDDVTEAAFRTDGAQHPAYVGRILWISWGRPSRQSVGRNVEKYSVRYENAHPDV